MKNKKILEDVYDYCRWNDNENIENILNSSSELIDILNDNGLFFRLAISYNNIEVLNTLLQYYEKTQLQGDTNALGYKVAKHKLQQVLQDAVSSFDVSEEAQQLLNNYLSENNDSEQEDSSFSYFFSNSTSINLPEENLKTLDDEHEIDFLGKETQKLESW